jgi:hypothetical protein
VAVFIPVRLRDEDFATCLVQRYLAAGTAGRVRYSGAYFERIGGGGDRPEVSCAFTAEDLLAVTMLSVRIEGYHALEILHYRARELNQLLSQIPPGIGLQDPGAAAHIARGGPAWRLGVTGHAALAGVRRAAHRAARAACHPAAGLAKTSEHRPVGLRQPVPVLQLQAAHALRPAFRAAVAAPRLTHSLRLAGQRPLLPRHRARHRRVHPLHGGQRGRAAGRRRIPHLHDRVPRGIPAPHGRPARARFTLYLGATYDNPVEGMFSFTPALSASDDGPRFTRPPYGDTRFVNPQSRQSPSGAKKPRPADEVYQARDAAVQACRDRDLAVQIRAHDM